MDLISKIRDAKSSLKKVINGAMPGIAAGLVLLGSYLSLNTYINRDRTPKAEPRTQISGAIEQSCDQSNPNYPFMSTAGGDEYNEGREIRAKMPLQERLELILNGDAMFDFDFPQYTPKTNVPELRGQPELRRAPEIKKSVPKYERLTNSQGQLYSRTPRLPNTRGVRNNNFGNIRRIPGKEWAGQIGKDGTFCRFKSPEHGLRAIAKNLIDKEGRYGDKTLRAIVKSWAPAIDGNNTNAYIADVSKLTGYHPDEELDLTNRETLISIVAAISKRDSGAVFPKETYERAVAMLPQNYLR